MATANPTRGMSDLYVSAELLAALEATGLTKLAIARAVAPAIGYSVNTVALLLVPGCRVPHNNGSNLVISAICEHLGFPIEKALTTTRLLRRETTASIERRFEQARARVRARRWRLTPEDCHSRRGSPYGRPDADDEAA